MHKDFLLLFPNSPIFLQNPRQKNTLKPTHVPHTIAFCPASRQSLWSESSTWNVSSKLRTAKKASDETQHRVACVCVCVFTCGCEVPFRWHLGDVRSANFICFRALQHDIHFTCWFIANAQDHGIERRWVARRRRKCPLWRQWLVGQPHTMCGNPGLASALHFPFIFASRPASTLHCANWAGIDTRSPLVSCALDDIQREQFSVVVIILVFVAARNQNAHRTQGTSACAAVRLLVSSLLVTALLR